MGREVVKGQGFPVGKGQDVPVALLMIGLQIRNQGLELGWGVDNTQQRLLVLFHDLPECESNGAATEISNFANIASFGR